jgi:hypothetical protein
MIEVYPTSRDKNWQKKADAMTVRLATANVSHCKTSSLVDEAFYNHSKGSSLMEKGSKDKVEQGRMEKDSKANLEGKPERMPLSKLRFFLFRPELSRLPVWEGIFNYNPGWTEGYRSGGRDLE